MLRLVFFLVVSCVLAWAAVWVVNHPGTVRSSGSTRSWC